MSLAAKLAEIYLEVTRFAKTKTVTGSGPSFKYVPIEDIADALRDAMGARGIVMVPSATRIHASEDAGTTKSGTTRWRHVIEVTWVITDGTDTLTVESVGEAMDTGDKGMNKAQTAARKYALIGAFQLSTGDDTDRAHPEPAVAPARRGPDVKARWEELVRVAGTAAGLPEALRLSGVNGSAELADEVKWQAALDVARGFARPGRASDPDDPRPAPDAAPPGQTTLGGGL